MCDLNGTMVTFQQLLDVIDVTPEQRMMMTTRKRDLKI
jgi:hypothetical protein